MSETAQPKRRADAERSIEQVLAAATALLADRPSASMAEIATAAGVARQTVYAHYTSREALLTAVAERARERAVAAIDAARPQAGPPVEALERLVRAWWDTVEPNARLIGALRDALHDQEAQHEFHAPILERIERLVRRGQRAGAFDRGVPATWLTSMFLAQMHAAAEEVAAGRMDAASVGAALETTVMRTFLGAG